MEVTEARLRLSAGWAAINREDAKKRDGESVLPGVPVIPTKSFRDLWLAPAEWAAFLGCSWTWCIGMFLPVLLVRDLGVWGWVVFAAPNVVGAAAMGWVLKTAAASQRISDEHRGACAAFSAVTIAFHVFFLLWFLPRLIGLPPVACAFALVAVYLLITINKPGWDLPAAAATWAVSLAMLGLFLRRHQPILPGVGSHRTIDVLWLAPVCVFGFLLCPYLDLTFHRARQNTSPDGARFAFGAGFSVCFLAMIVFSLIYATALSPLLDSSWRERVPAAFALVIAIHMIVQSAFTLAVHTRSFVTAQVPRGAVVALLLLAQVALLLGLAGNFLPRYHGLDAGELVYRLLIAFYGLVFPAYVWGCMIPRRDGRTAMSVRAVVLGVVVAAPMYWMGFIENRPAWLVPGLAAVLLSRYAVPRGTALPAGTGPFPPNASGSASR